MTTYPNFIDNKAATARPDMYITVQADTAKFLKSWRLSVFSYEWLDKDGAIKDIKDMSETESQRRKDTQTAFENGAPLEKPVLGIGIQDNVEIGSGRAVLMTLTAAGITSLPVHIPKSNESDFKDFLAEID